MPSPNHLKIKERVALAERIEKNGTEMKMAPCRACFTSGRKCVVSPHSKRCSECVQRNTKCDVSAPSVSDWEKLRLEEARLEAEEELAAQQEQEAFARRMRLRRMQKLLKSRGGEMLRRGLATLDELEAVEERERKEAEEKAEAERNAHAGANPFATTDPGLDFSSEGDLLAAVSPSFWEGLDVPNGNLPTSQG